jgi:hypothetical protein
LRLCRRGWSGDAGSEIRCVEDSRELQNLMHLVVQTGARRRRRTSTTDDLRQSSYDVVPIVAKSRQRNCETKQLQSPIQTGDPKT